MIVVDTSAFIAVVLGEPEAASIEQTMSGSDPLLVSAATLAEILIVARRRAVGGQMAKHLEALALQIIPVTSEFAERVADTYDRWGKGVHPAGLNILDCFAYALAMERGCPLLFIGEDFAKTDVIAALPAK